MKLFPILAVSVLAATQLIAEETRQLDAHEHGVGQLNIAFDGQNIAMELNAPGADIVGFEYAAESAVDRATVDNAVATLAAPQDLFVLPDSAGCTVVQAGAELEKDDDHTEFHAEYMLTCADPAAITQIAFAYFDTFPNALEVEVQIISDTGATSFEVERDAPVLDLRGMF